MGTVHYYDFHFVFKNDFHIIKKGFHVFVVCDTNRFLRANQNVNETKVNWKEIIASSSFVKDAKESLKKWLRTHIHGKLKSSVKSKVWRLRRRLTPSASRVPSIIVTMAMLLATTRHHGFL